MMPPGEAGGGARSGPRIAAAARLLGYHRIDARTLIWLTVALVAVGTICRGLFAATIDLGTDEAYYWSWSREAVVSYLDHPPMVAWFARLGTAIFGDTTFGVRFMGIPALLAAELLLASVVRRTTGDIRAGAFVVLAMEATLGYGVVIMLVKPDVPLLPFAAALIFALARLHETRDPRWWLAAGLFGGLALLSKFTAVFLLPAILLFVLWPKQNRRWLLGPWPWLGLAVAVVVFSPVLWWNASHDWASFRFQGTRIAADAWSPLSAANFILASLAFMGPILVPAITIGSVAVLIRAWTKRDAIPLLLASAFVLPIAYLLQRSFFIEIIPTWPYVLWMFGIAAGACNAANAWSPVAPERQAASAGIWATLALATGFAIVGATYWHTFIDRGTWFGNLDPLGQEAGFDDLAAKVGEIARAEGAGWIATSDYRTYAMLLWHLGGEVPVVQVNERSRFIGFALPDPATFGKPAIVVTRGSDGLEAEALPPEATMTQLGQIERTWRGVAFGTYTLQKAENWTPDLDPAPGTPAYEWPQLALWRHPDWR